MKKHLLLFSLGLSSIGLSQQLEQSNELIIGANATMYECADTTSSLSNIMGSNVTWDYSNVVGLSSTTRPFEVLDPLNSAFVTDFPMATKVISIQNSFQNFFFSSPSERTSTGFVFSEATLGDVVAKYDVNHQIVMTYPFAYGNSVSDDFSGSLSFNFSGVPQNPTCTGKSYATIDGKGTLKLPSSNTFIDVIRYKLVDTIFTQVDLIGPMDIEFIRTQLEYYDLANTNLPLFIHTNIKVQQTGSTTPFLDNSVVLSSVNPIENLGLVDQNNTSFEMFPNPSKGQFKIQLPDNAQFNVQVMDLNGKSIFEAQNLNSTSTIDLEKLQKGCYLVKVFNNDSSNIKTLVLE